jgi:hypothetical protein
MLAQQSRNGRLNHLHHVTVAVAAAPSEREVNQPPGPCHLEPARRTRIIRQRIHTSQLSRATPTAPTARLRPTTSADHLQS